MKLLSRITFFVVLGMGIALGAQAGSNLGGAFAMKDHHGKEVSDKTYLGNYLLMVFGYTYCPDVCPTGLQTISDAVDMLDEKGKKVQPIFVTIDPERDTVEVMKDYVSNFHPRLIGLTGTLEQTKAMAKLFKVRYRKNIEEDSEPDEYLVDHTASFYLMGPDGKFVNSYSHRTRPEQMAEWVGEAIK